MDPAATAKDLVRRITAGRRRSKPSLPLHGFEEQRTPAPLLDRLSDDELERLNDVLPWACFTADGRGRRVGDVAWAGKRDEPQVIPDRRGILLDERFGLADKHVLEIGCFEGVHTIGLCQRAAQVTAVDARVENVVKTIVRCAFYGWHPEVFVCDVEDGASMAQLQADVVHHVGVLYHLRDPVAHLLALGRVARDGVLLDTHVATPAEATESMELDGRTYAYRRYREGGVDEVFSGMYEHAKWLTLEGLVDVLGWAGFGKVDVVEERAERNGTRVLVVGGRS